MAIKLRIIDYDHREINQMHARVNQTVDGNQDAGHFVHVNVIVERNECRESPCTQERDTLAQHQHQNERTIEVQTLTYIELKKIIYIFRKMIRIHPHFVCRFQFTTCACDNNKYVAFAILNCTGHKQSDIDGNEQREKCQEYVIVFHIWCGQLMRQTTPFGNRFLGRFKWQRYQPSIDTTDREEIKKIRTQLENS